MDGRNSGPKVWLDYDQEALDRQYDQRALVPNADEYIARNARDSAEVRARLDCRLNVAYGPSPDETLDIFPAGDNTPVIVYVHGGAWTRWSKDENSYQAPVFVDAGAAFVSVNFALAPQVSLDELVRQNRATVKWVYNHALDFGADPGRLYIAGHSSGAPSRIACGHRLGRRLGPTSRCDQRSDCRQRHVRSGTSAPKFASHIPPSGRRLSGTKLGIAKPTGQYAADDHGLWRPGTSRVPTP